MCIQGNHPRAHRVFRFQCRNSHFTCYPNRFLLLIINILCFIFSALAYLVWTVQEKRRPSKCWQVTFARQRVMLTSKTKGMESHISIVFILSALLFIRHSNWLSFVISRVSLTKWIDNCTTVDKDLFNSAFLIIAYSKDATVFSMVVNSNFTHTENELRSQNSKLQSSDH